MATEYATFIATYLEVSISSKIARSAFRALWTEKTGSSSGILKMYSHFKENEINKTHIIGYKIKTSPIVQKVETPIVSVIETPIAAKPVMDEYKMAKLEMMKKKMEEDRLIAEKKMEQERLIAEKKMEEERLIAEKQMETKCVLADKQTEQLQMKLATKVELTTKKLELEEKKHLEFIKQKELDRSHSTMENNKNRRMFLFNHHPYLELQYYGNAASQYQTAFSTKMNIFTKLAIHESIDQKDDQKVSEIINNVVDKKATLLPIVNPTGNLVDEHLVHVKEHAKSIEQVLEELKKENIVEPEINHDWVNEVKQQVAIVASVGKRDNLDMMVPSYMEMLTDINKEKLNESQKPKASYVKPKNHARINRNDGEMYIRCFTCSNECKLSDSGVHRSHNLPKSKNGSWAKNNIYLCCATCNQSMGNENTIEEYVCTKIGNRLSGISVSFKECIDLGYISDCGTYDSDIDTEDDGEYPIDEEDALNQIEV